MKTCMSMKYCMAVNHAINKGPSTTVLPRRSCNYIYIRQQASVVNLIIISIIYQFIKHTIVTQHVN